ncbi:restriction endonuclease [uncultured Brevundimonas sp.]|uniref:restriction endonuclease n=1 Tax=Brevundimonas sp. TaxID=1871086 RepID=UPI0028D6517C|nr:restriction endonuclease [uncultured Brevundimonas sp.]
MPLITQIVPSTWQELEIGVRDILAECGMDAERQVQIPLVRGGADVDVLATDEAHGIRSVIICECKYWDSNLPQAVAHAFRTVVADSGANRGYIISRRGFQAGTYEAVANTNVELLTYAEFQERFFERWYRSRVGEMENAIGQFNVYYEPLGIPGMGRLLDAGDEAAADAYYAVWKKYLFAGLMLQRFSPYLMLFRQGKIAELPIELPMSPEGEPLVVPDDVREAKGYRELFQRLTAYGLEGLRELRSHNPVTRGVPEDQVESDD